MSDDRNLARLRAAQYEATRRGAEETYEPTPGVFVGRPPCVHCHNAFRLHTNGACPQQYRPATLEEAQRALDDAVASGDPGRLFIARGDLQRLQGRR